MLRPIAAVLSGYALMSVLVLAAFSLVLAAPDFAFRAGSFDVTPAWLAYTLVASLLAAVAGGYVSARIARSRRPLLVLAVLVVVIGLGSAVANGSRERAPEVVPEGMSLTDRASRAVQPTWYAYTVPFVGAAGVLLGGFLRRREPAGA